MTLNRLPLIVAVVAFVGFPLSAQAATCWIYQVTIWGQTDSGFGPQAFSNINQYLALRVPGVVDPITGESNRLELVITNFPNQLFSLQNAINPQQLPTGSVELMTNSIYANNLGVRSAQSHLADVSFYAAPENVGGYVIEFALNFIGLAPHGGPAPNFVVMPSRSALGGLDILQGLTDYILQMGGGPGLAVAQTLFLIPVTQWDDPFTSGGAFLFSPDFNVVQGILRMRGRELANFNLAGDYVANVYGRFLQTVQCQ
jgi:hypothetical protein